MPSDCHGCGREFHIVCFGTDSWLLTAVRLQGFQGFKVFVDRLRKVRARLCPRQSLELAVAATRYGLTCDDDGAGAGLAITTLLADSTVSQGRDRTQSTAPFGHIPSRSVRLFGGRLSTRRGQEAPTSQAILTFASSAPARSEGVRDAQMRSSLLPSAKGNCRIEIEHPAPSPRRVACCGQSRVKQPRGPAGLAACNKDVQTVAFGSFEPRRAAISTNPCSEFTQPASTASSSSSISRMQSRPVGIEAIGRNFARHGLRACASPYLQVSRRDALQPDARRDCVPSSPPRSDAVDVVHQGPARLVGLHYGKPVSGRPKSGWRGGECCRRDDTRAWRAMSGRATASEETSRRRSRPHQTRRATIRQARAYMHVLVYGDIRCYRNYS